MKETWDKNDLTRGPIVKQLLLFFLPIAAGTLIQQLYNTVDAFVVSKYVGADALAAVGGSPAIISNLVIGFCVSLAGGCAVVIAQRFGAGEKEEVTAAVKISFVFCAILGLVIGVVVVSFSPQILQLLKTPKDTFADADLYQRIYFSGAIFLLVFNIGAGILRAVGNSRFPFYCLLVSCGLNIALDFLFVAAFHWDVFGVAVATVLAQAVSAVMVFVYLLRTKECYRLVFKNNPYQPALFKRMLGIGIPSGLQSSMYGLSNLIMQIAVNTLGTTMVASWAMSSKIDGVYWAVTSAFGTTITSYIGQNYGARKAKRIRESTKKGLYLHLGMTVLISGLLLLGGQWFLNLITDDTGVQKGTWLIMTYVVPGYIMWSFIEVYSGVLRGIGDTVIPSILIAVGICVSRIAWIYTAFEITPKIEIVCISYPLSWFLTAIAVFVYYLLRRKRLDEELRGPVYTGMETE